MLTPHRGAKSRPSLDGAYRTGSPSDPDDPPNTVLPSSTELFFFYGQNLEQCAKLSTEGMLVEMFGVWGKWLRIYAGLLIACRSFAGS
jgi:vacuolar protein sorting-associated protein 53